MARNTTITDTKTTDTKNTETKFAETKFAGSRITDEAARKRQEIGLSARRESSRSTVMRPPGSSANEQDGSGGWWLVLFLSLLAVATFLLITARFLQSPTDLATVDAQVSDISRGRINLQGVEGMLARLRGQFRNVGGTNNLSLDLSGATPRLFDDFTADQSLLAEVKDNYRSLELDRSAGLYRMRIESGNASWSLLGDPSLRHYRLETNMRLLLDNPQGSAGLITRFADENHFYLFTIDGNAHFRVVQADGAGNWQELIPWTASSAINGAGAGNVLEVEDWGDRIRFSVNATPLYQHQVDYSLIGKSGDAGLWVAATVDEAAEAEFSQIRLEPLEN